MTRNPSTLLGSNPTPSLANAPLSCWTPLFALGAAFMALAALLAVLHRRSAN